MTADLPERKETESPFNIDRLIKIGIYAAIAAFIFSLMFALYSDAHARGLNESFLPVFLVVGFILCLCVLKILRERGK